MAEIMPLQKTETEPIPEKETLPDVRASPTIGASGEESGDSNEEFPPEPEKETLPEESPTIGASTPLTIGDSGQITIGSSGQQGTVPQNIDYRPFIPLGIAVLISGLFGRFVYRFIMDNVR